MGGLYVNFERLESQALSVLVTEWRMFTTLAQFVVRVSY